MTTAPKINRQAYRDALAYLYAKASADQDGMRAVGTGCDDPAGMLDAMADMSLGLAAIATNAQPKLWLDRVRDDLDALLDAYDARRTDEDGDAS